MLPPSERVEVGPDEVGMRLDAFLAARFSQHSRARLRCAIIDGGVTVDGQKKKPSFHISEGQQIRITLPPRLREGPEPENIPIDILYEDDAIAVINKQSGIVVHPSKGHLSGTLAGALAFHLNQLSTVGGPIRPGIVHRLDRETSGVIVVAKSDSAHQHMAKQFEQRTVKKTYVAIVAGVPERDADRITQPIGTHPYQREKMAIRADHKTSRSAETFYEVVERYSRHALLHVSPKTGRTHQIRVHLAHSGTPVLCDRLYGGRSSISRDEITGLSDDTAPLLERLALHAHRLLIEHPTTGEPIEFIAPLANDLEEVLTALRAK